MIPKHLDGGKMDNLSEAINQASTTNLVVVTPKAWGLGWSSDEYVTSLDLNMCINYTLHYIYQMSPIILCYTYCSVGAPETSFFPLWIYLPAQLRPEHLPSPDQKRGPGRKSWRAIQCWTSSSRKVQLHVNTTTISNRMGETLAVPTRAYYKMFESSKVPCHVIY